MYRTYISGKKENLRHYNTNEYTAALASTKIYIYNTLLLSEKKVLIIQVLKLSVCFAGSLISTAQYYI